MPPKRPGGEASSGTIPRPHGYAKGKRTRGGLYCKFYNQGNCRYGAECAFLHLSESSGSTGIAMASNNTEHDQEPATAKPRELQRQMTQNDAELASESGEQELSSHPSTSNARKRTRTRRRRGDTRTRNPPAESAELPTVAEVDLGEPETVPTEDQRASESAVPELCIAWQRGKCRRGDRCRYSHDMVLDDETLIQNARNDLRRLAERRERRREEQRQQVAEERRMEEERRQQEEERRRLEEERRQWEEERRRQQEEERQRREGERRQQEEERRRREEERKRQQEEERQRREEERRQQEEERQRQEEERRRQKEERQRQEDERRRQQEEERQRREEERKRQQEEERKRREEVQKKLEEAQQRERERLERQRAEREAQRLAAIERRRREEEDEQRRQALEAKKKEIKRRERQKRQTEARETRQLVVQGSNLVTFGAGLQVMRVIPGFDLCNITIRNIPVEANDFEIKRLFHEQGMDDTQFQLASCKTENNNTQTAKVLLRAEEARVIAVGLEDLEFHDNFITLEVGENASWGSMTSSSRSDEMKTLTIILHITSVTMVARYRSMEQAKAQVKRLHGMSVDNRRISATLNDRNPWVEEASIQLENIDPKRQTNEIAVLAEARSVEIVKSDAYNLNWFLSWLEQTLERRGAIVGSFETTKIDDTRMRASAKFHSRDALETAATALERSSPISGQGPELQVVVPSPQQEYSIKIWAKQYRAQKVQWDALTERRRGQKAYVRITERKNNGRVSIKVHGSDEEEIGALKVRVEGLVAGERLDADHWHNSFYHSEMALLEKVSEETGVYLSFDSRYLALRVFGGSNEVALAKDRIRREVQRLGLMEYAIPIARQSVRFFVATGLPILKEALGEENVTLDVGARKCTLKLRGGDDAIKHAKKLLEEALTAATDGVVVLPNEGNEDGIFCPICYDTPTHPEILSCGHLCCEPCLRHYITSAATSKQFPLVCMGNGATCNMPISIPIIERYLTKQRFDHLIDVVFSSHIQSNPRRFKYCPTPDCIQIYQCDTDKQFHKCPSCFTEICSSCNEKAHQGMTCEERQIHINPAEQERLTEEWAQSNNVKRCPSCSVLTEKTAGCNHMTCRCGVHFCWICLGLFDPQNIYEHMEAVHGGIDGEVIVNNNIQRIGNQQRNPAPVRAAPPRPVVPDHQLNLRPVGHRAQPRVDAWVREQQQGRQCLEERPQALAPPPVHAWVQHQRQEREQQRLEEQQRQQEELLQLYHYEQQRREEEQRLQEFEAEAERARIFEGWEDERQRYNEAYERERQERGEREAQMAAEVAEKEEGSYCTIM